jgi:hypothetical protein
LLWRFFLIGNQGCHIFLGTIYPNGGKYTKWTWNISNGRKIDQMVFSIARPSKIDPNWDFWFENKPSGNPGRNQK